MPNIERIAEMFHIFYLCPVVQGSLYIIMITEKKLILN